MIDVQALKTLKRMIDSLFNENEILRNGAASRIDDFFRRNGIHPSELEITPAGTSLYVTFQEATAIYEKEIRSLSNKLTFARSHLPSSLMTKLDAIDENSVVTAPDVPGTFHNENVPGTSLEDNVPRTFRHRNAPGTRPHGEKPFRKVHKTILHYIFRHDPHPVPRDEIANTVMLSYRTVGPRLSELTTDYFGPPSLLRRKTKNESMIYYTLTEAGKTWAATIKLSDLEGRRSRW